nr:MAG TPA: hypothetical protein [Caudoviricetes sp.]
MLSFPHLKYLGKCHVVPLRQVPTRQFFQSLCSVCFALIIPDDYFIFGSYPRTAPPAGQLINCSGAIRTFQGLPWGSASLFLSAGRTVCRPFRQLRFATYTVQKDTPL